MAFFSYKILNDAKNIMVSSVPVGFNETLSENIIRKYKDLNNAHIMMANNKPIYKTIRSVSELSYENWIKINKNAAFALKEMLPEIGYFHEINYPTSNYLKFIIDDLNKFAKKAEKSKKINYKNLGDLLKVCFEFIALRDIISDKNIELFYKSLIDTLFQELEESLERLTNSKVISIEEIDEYKRNSSKTLVDNLKKYYKSPVNWKDLDSIYSPNEKHSYTWMKQVRLLIFKEKQLEENNDAFIYEKTFYEKSRDDFAIQGSYLNEILFLGVAGLLLAHRESLKELIYEHSFFVRKTPEEYFKDLNEKDKTIDEIIEKYESKRKKNIENLKKLENINGVIEQIAEKEKEKEEDSVLRLNVDLKKQIIYFYYKNISFLCCKKEKEDYFSLFKKENLNEIVLLNNFISEKEIKDHNLMFMINCLNLEAFIEEIKNINLQEYLLGEEFLGLLDVKLNFID